MITDLEYEELEYKEIHHLIKNITIKIIENPFISSKNKDELLNILDLHFLSKLSKSLGIFKELT